MKLHYSLMPYLRKYLIIMGAEVNDEVVHYRYLMFKMENNEWTQGYSNSRDNYINFAGPEMDLIEEFINVVDLLNPALLGREEPGKNHAKKGA